MQTPVHAFSYINVHPDRVRRTHAYAVGSATCRAAGRGGSSLVMALSAFLLLQLLLLAALPGPGEAHHKSTETARAAAKRNGADAREAEPGTEIFEEKINEGRQEIESGESLKQREWADPRGKQ